MEYKKKILKDIDIKFIEINKKIEAINRDSKDLWKMISDLTYYYAK